MTGCFGLSRATRSSLGSGCAGGCRLYELVMWVLGRSMLGKSGAVTWANPPS